MRHLGMVFVFTATAAALTGCGQISGLSAPTARGGMAVVDLDKVAAETGRDRILAQSLELEQNSLNQSLKKIVENANEQLSAKKKEYGDELTPEEKKEYTDMANNAATKLTQIQNQARAEYEQFKQKQIAKFRADLKPIAQEVAAKRGLSIVIPKNEGLLLSVDSGVDITDDVIKVLREKHPVTMAAPQKVETAAKPEPAVTPTKSTAKRSSAKSAARNVDADEQESVR